MNLRNRIVILNVGILCGLVLEYFRGVRIVVIVGCGLFLFLFANLLLFRRQKEKKPQ